MGVVGCDPVPSGSERRCLLDDGGSSIAVALLLCLCLCWYLGAEDIVFEDQQARVWGDAPFLAEQKNR